MPVSRRNADFIAVLVGLAVASCEESQRADAPTTAVKSGVMIAGVQSSARCPGHDSLLILGEPGSKEAVYDTLPLVGANTNVPEFHDCQRFIDSVGSNYGPLIGVFAVSSSAGFNPTPATPERRLDLRDGPVSSDPDTSGEPVARAPRHPDGYPIGIIVDFDRVGYAPLGIQPGVNCLYVYPAAGTPHGLGATLVPVGTRASDCAKGFSRSLTGTELLVFSRRMPLDHPNDYPPVARWDWDAASMTQYIGIRCGPRWCEIGRKEGFTRSATHLYPIPDRKERRVFAVKGWHDEQWLARPGIAGLYPRPFRGTLVPVKNLADFDSVTFRNPAWTDVARVAISPHDPVYESKFHLTTSSMPLKMNRVALCHGSFDQCRAADPSVPATTRAPTCAATTTNTWWARITNTHGEKFFHCVTRRPHRGITMPGTARWLWEDDDELIWVECDEGCCQVHRGTEF